MKKLEINKKINGKTQQLELAIGILCLINNIYLSKTDLTVLAYYITYKINEKTDSLIISSGIVKSVKVLSNVKTKLHKLGFLKRTKELYKTYELALTKDFDIENSEIDLSIKISTDQ